MSVSEFDLIEKYFRNLTAPTSTVPVGIGDDCAVLDIPADEQLLISVDTLVETVHFPRDYPPAYLARRALAVCVSDLAASGAKPLAFTLALTLPKVREEWLAAFSASLRLAADEYGIALVGGDTTRGPLCLSLQVMGSAPRGQALLRNGAQVGDRIYVSGNLGDARAALDCLAEAQPDEHQQRLLLRYHHPEPRLALGMALRGIATAAVDVSDGVAADLGHILKASGVGACLQLGALPLSDALRSNAEGAALDYALAGGDDYELCFTAPVNMIAQVAGLSRQLNISLSDIGCIEENLGLRCLDRQGNPYSLPAGYQHF